MVKLHKPRNSSWSWSYGSKIYNYAISAYLNPAQEGVGVFSKQHYVIKFVSELPQVGGFLLVLRFLHQ